MAINPFDIVDYLEDAREQVTYQFKEKDIIDRYIQLLINSELDIQLAMKDTAQLRSVDTAFGEQLDVIGRVVGQPRTPLPGRLFGQVDPVIPDDTVYRLLIKAKITKNNTKSTPEDVIAGAEYVLSVDGITIQESIAAYIVYVPRYLTDFEKFLVTGIVTEYYTYTLLPKPVGVRVDFIEFYGPNFFAFEGVPNAKGFGSYTGTIGYGANYGKAYGESDFNTSDGGIFANFAEV
jgi:hypothetical protein